MSPLRVAVIGVGHLGRIHARLAAGLEELDLVAVVDPVKETRERVAEEVGTRPVADYRELVGEIEAAIVATPTVTHREIGCELLNSGIPVLIEKPPSRRPRPRPMNWCRWPIARDSCCKWATWSGSTRRCHAWRRSCAIRSTSTPGEPAATRSVRRTWAWVLDVMIHDLDVVLSLARSEVVDVQAFGISVLGGHEDMATARLTFASGCIADVTASRVSPQQQRVTNVLTSRASASIDFATHQTTVIRPRQDILRREFRVERLSADQREHFKQHQFDDLLVRTEYNMPAGNAIEEEQRDFEAAVRSGRSPRVDGAAGRDAVALAETILEHIEEHAWDGTDAGRRGPLAMPALPIIAGTTVAEEVPIERRRAG